MNYGHGGNISEFARQNSINKNSIIDFSSNVNWYGPPAQLLEYIKNNVDQIVHYPEITNNKLINKLSDYYNLDNENIIAGNGSAELIFLLVKILKVKTVYIVEPNFSEYLQAAEANNIKIISLLGKEQNNFKQTPLKLISEMNGDSILFISNPNNPIGYIYTEEELLLLAEKLGKINSYLFVDEAFIDFIKSTISSSIISKIIENKNLIVLRSLTKILAIPGLRLGILVADEKIISKIKLVQPPWSVNYFAQLVGEKIIEFNDFIEASLIKIWLEKERVITALKEIGVIELLHGEANYILCKIVENKNVSDLQEFLSCKNIMIRNCSNYRGLNNSYFRIAIRKREDNELLIKAITEFFNG